MQKLLEINDSKSNKELWFLIGLVLAYTFALFTYVNDFYVPDSDFFDFREKAIAWRNLEIPENIKRPPLYSLLIGIISIGIPGHFRELYAAEAINVTCGIGVVLLAFLIAKKFIGRYAFIVAWLVATNPLAIKMVVKPKSEILATVLILWAFWYFLRQSRWSYLFALLASMVRFEGVLLVPAFALHDFFFKKEYWRSILLGGLAISFTVAWLLLSNNDSSETSRTYQSYLTPDRLLQGLHFLNNFFGAIIRFLPVKLFKIWTVLAGFLMLIGAYRCFRITRHLTFSMAIYLLLYMILHFIWPFSIDDYVVMVYWICYVFICTGISVITSKLVESETWHKVSRKSFMPALAATLSGIVLIVLNLTRNPIHEYDTNFGIFLLFMVPLVIYLWHTFTKVVLRKVLIVSLVLIPLSVVAWRGNAATNEAMFNLKYAKAEYRWIGEWYQLRYQPGQKLFMMQPNIAAYYTRLQEHRDFVSFSTIKVKNMTELVNWLRHNDITYVAWVCHQKRRDTEDSWYQWRVDNRNLLLMDELGAGKNTPDFDLVQEFRDGPRWAYIYRLKDKNSQGDVKISCE